MIHFDTNFLVVAAVPGSAADLRFRTWAAANESFGMSTVAWFPCFHFTLHFNLSKLQLPLLQRHGAFNENPGDGPDQWEEKYAQNEPAYSESEHPPGHQFGKEIVRQWQPEQRKEKGRSA